jgi:hypothetical protein
MKNNEWYVIADIPNFINSARLLVFNSFGGADNHGPIDSALASLNEEDRNELDTVLSYDESYNIAMETVKKQYNKKTKETRYLISDETFVSMIDFMNERMISNMLNNLVNKGILESGFDNESNEFVFWIKNNENQKEIDKPETD